MKLRNKKTGEIVDNILEAANRLNNNKNTFTLAELNEEWEDYEEPKSGIKDVWFPDVIEGGNNVVISFGTKEEAEKAVEKLKAWTRLEDKGFRFDGYDVAHNSNGDLCGQLFYNAGDYCIEDVEKDLDLLFGGEE